MNALLLALCGLLSPLPSCSDGGAEETAKATEFTRFVRASDGSASLDVAIVRYEDADGRVVDLVGAVHVGDADYYALLNRAFRVYDSVLYEMVKPKEVDPASIGKGEDGSLISQFQRALKDLLELEFQLDAIDYGAKNFVHADLDPETFYRLQEERGESLLKLMLQAALQQAKESAADPSAGVPDELALLAALFQKDRARALKLSLGEQFGRLEKIAAGFEKGPRGEESVLVVERNKAALAALKSEIGKDRKRFAIFYGAAHMPDMERRLVSEFGMKKQNLEWIPAWTIEKPR